MGTLGARLRLLIVVVVLSCAVASGGLRAQGQVPDQGGVGAMAQRPMPVGPYKISGVVVDALSGAPLAKARVSISAVANRGGGAWSMITAEDGRFEFTSIPQGKFALRGDRLGYLWASYEQHEQFSTAIVTGPGLESEDLVLRLTPMASIRGTVTDEAGEPVRNANVHLYINSHDNGLDRVVEAGQQSTDDQGVYEFALVAPGTYFVSVAAIPWYAVHPPYSSAEDSNLPAASVPKSLDVAYPLTFYNGATDSEAATPISVRGGDHLDVNLHLNPVPALHVLIHVARDQQHGFSTPWFQPRVFDSPPSFPEQMTSRFLSSIDMVEVTGIPAGKYSMIQHSSKTGGPNQVGEVVLSEDGQEVNVSQVEQGARVKIAVKMTGSSRLPKPLYVNLQRLPVGGPIVASGEADDKGEAVLEDVQTGKYRIRIGSAAQIFSVLRYTGPSGEVSGNILEVASGTPQDVTAYVAAGVVSIEGYVRRKGKAASGVMIALIPKNTESREMFRRDQSDSDGSFALRVVVPGSYTIVAIDDAWGFPWQQRDALARYVKYGQNVTNGELMTGSVQLPEPLEVQPH
jgi:5-hydroxyisourate hydrolase-like protein (transthyretin family)